MDKRILISFLALIIFLGVVIGIRMLLHSCQPPLINFEPATPEVGELVKFKNLNGSEVLWTIGNDKAITGSEFDYKFQSSGKFNVKASNGKDCQDEREITIMPPCEMVRFSPEITVPDKIIEKESVVFTDQTKGSTSWQWNVDGISETGTSNEFTFRFPSPGKYKLSLTIIGKCLKGDTSFVVNVGKAVPSVTPVKKEQKEIAKDFPKQKEKPFLPDDGNLFTQYFLDISNDLCENSSASENWKDQIVSKCCTICEIDIYLNGSYYQKVTLDNYKKRMINCDFSVSSAMVIAKNSPNCIKQIRVYATKKNEN
jgi:hypothetical protein